jgi:hypothetical protein
LLTTHPKTLAPNASIGTVQQTKESPSKSIERKSTGFWVTQKGDQQPNINTLSMNEKSFY